MSNSSFVLIQQGEEIVSIPLFKKQDYEEVKNYLIAQEKNIESLPTFFKPFYGVERENDFLR